MRRTACHTAQNSQSDRALRNTFDCTSFRAPWTKTAAHRAIDSIVTARRDQVARIAPRSSASFQRSLLYRSRGLFFVAIRNQKWPACAGDGTEDQIDGHDPYGPFRMALTLAVLIFISCHPNQWG